MPALTPTSYEAKVVWMSVVGDRAAALESTRRDSLRMTFGGPEGEDYGGEVRPSCSRVVAQHPKGTPIRNVRQLSIVGSDDLRAIAAALGINRLDPSWIGATMVLDGLPDLSYLPPSSRLQSEVDGTTLVVDMQNRPCHLPSAVIEVAAPGRGRNFKAAAKGRRGVTAWVEREGTIRIADVLRLHVPDQRGWTGMTGLHATR
jgi:hypothetical protein